MSNQSKLMRNESPWKRRMAEFCKEMGPSQLMVVASYLAYMIWQDMALWGNQWVPTTVLAVGLFTGYLVAFFKRMSQYRYGQIELMVAAFVLLVSTGKLVNSWNSQVDRWAGIATLFGAVYLASRAFENIRNGKEKRDYILAHGKTRMIHWSQIILAKEQSVRTAVPERAGVYVFAQENDGLWEALYVGQAYNLRESILGHISERETNVCLKTKIASHTVGFVYAEVAGFVDQDGIVKFMYDELYPICNQRNPGGTPISVNHPTRN